MKKIFFLVKVLVIYAFLNFSGIAKESVYFTEGVEFFKKKEFEKSKILFERDLVFNPKSEKSYLYLAKIFSIDDNVEEQEKNLNNVLLLNPKNDEALYMLLLIKIKQSNYNKTKELLNTFDLVCKSFCSKKDEIQKKFEKLSPDKANDIN
tara:strand:- start:426 stop:875 length:450 start_codon:yes stop_codon:yes gene_type:complete